MVDLVQQYDPDAEPNAYDTVPAGTYQAEIIESAREPISKDNDLGECLNLCWKIVAGELEGRLFWQRLNLWWTGDEKTPGTVVKIANAQFKDVRDATGVQFPSDSVELHHISCMVTYGPQKKDPNYSEVKSVKPIGGAPVKQVANGAPKAANQPRQAAPAAGAGKPEAPWRKAN